TRRVRRGKGGRGIFSLGGVGELSFRGKGAAGVRNRPKPSDLRQKATETVRKRPNCVRKPPILTGATKAAIAQGGPLAAGLVVCEKLSQPALAHPDEPGDDEARGSNPPLAPAIGSSGVWACPPLAGEEHPKGAKGV